MEQRLREVLAGKWGSSILPFFWQHGEEREKLCEGMERIRESGLRAVCVESRPHPDFVGEGWWRDLDIIMEKAKELGMKVWVLDDAHFPSGYCNGMVTEDSPYGKIYLTHYGIDVVGPRTGLSFMVKLEEGEELVGVTLSRRDEADPHRQNRFADLTDQVSDGRVFADIPEGVWCVNVIKTTRRGSGRKNYINTIDRDAVRYFIEQVYEPHYEHYREDFGITFAGFFSDEPEIGNCGGEYGHDANIGIMDMALPWSDAVNTDLRARWGKDFVCNLMSLWLDTDEQKDQNKTGLLRAQFMDLISELYGENFCGQIGAWCRAHGVEYIGHVIEDGGTHAHLGLGTGHFFRALWGQDMSGIDVVLQQIRPRLDDLRFHSIGGRIGYHGAFFHYGLAKLGVSLAYLDPKKQGRTMCEVFGAYGWSEGLKLMKWLMDHMLVNGVNYFVPHAFTMKDFPDPDCPPHFYARGMNQQFPWFRDLMEYCERVSHLIKGGHPVVSAAILYTAEQEWMGEFIPFERAGMELAKNQIDYAVLPADALLLTAVKDGKLSWGQESNLLETGVLIILGSRCISKKLAEWLKKAESNGLRLVFYETVPKILLEDGSLSEYPLASQDCGTLDGETRKREGNVQICPEGHLAAALIKMECHEVEINTGEPWVRICHYRHTDGQYWLLLNESDVDTVDTALFFTMGAPVSACWYDAWKNRCEPCEWDADGRLVLKLAPGEMKVLYCGQVEDEYGRQLKELEERQKELTRGEIVRELPEAQKSWKIMVKEAGEAQFLQLAETELGDFGKNHPWFSGILRYKTTFSADKGKACLLDLGEVYETAVVSVNGVKAGVRISPPYQFDITDFLRDGENMLVIEVVNTLVNRQRDVFSMTMPMEPSGLLGPVRILAADEAFTV